MLTVNNDTICIGCLNISVDVIDCHGSVSFDKRVYCADQFGIDITSQRFEAEMDSG